MKHLFCDACGDSVKAVYPCKFVFHDKDKEGNQRFVDLNICPECMKYGKITIDLPRKRLVSIVLNRLKSSKPKRLWKKRSESKKFGGT